MKFLAQILVKIFAVIAILLLAIILVWGLLLSSYPTYSWHQKMTVEVETPDGIKTGSSVTSVKWVDGSNPAIGWNSYYKGEAVVVDMGEGRYLFALLRRVPTGRLQMSSMLIGALSKRKSLGASKKLFDEIVNKHGRASGVVELPDYQYPTLVTFDDLDDSTSVQKVDSHNMAKYFGEGVKLKRITLEVTDEPVTRGTVGKLLTWLVDYSGPRLAPAIGGNIAEAPFNRLVRHLDFWRK